MFSNELNDCSSHYADTFLLVSKGLQSVIIKVKLKDWVYEVFRGKYITSSESPIELILRQTPEGLLAEMNFQHLKIKTVTRTGTWEVETERVIRFDDGKSPHSLLSNKEGVSFAFQTKEGLVMKTDLPFCL